MTLEVKPEIATALEAWASAKGLSVKDATRSEASGMVSEKRAIGLPYRQATAIARSR
jgi:hypothetical protein